MAHYIPEQDPYRLEQLTSDGSDRPIHQMDAAFREVTAPDGTELLLWSSRPQLTDTLYAHVEEVVRLQRTHKHFPSAGALSMPTFHAYVEGSSYRSPADGEIVPGEQWVHMGSPGDLADNIQLDVGITVPPSVLADLQADSTLAWYSDLHVDHIGPVFQMEALRRDCAYLDYNPSTGVPAEQRAALGHYASALGRDLHERRLDSWTRRSAPDQLIGGQTSDWTEQARIQELRTWPGGEATQKVIGELDQAVAAWQLILDKPWTIAPDRSEYDLHDDQFYRSLHFSTDMSKARVQDWADAAKSRTLTPH
ncbi:hypothetical protein HQ346_14420 [Rhodococcus sp. BP-252]|uniref:hypothetical protein n=1 Tax=unclassified Rhodococcus (in: high G+C Gram-positive bacteria) TaxID=192944 RepID=UPI001C9B478D|nr:MULTISPECIES: hypothetical protein [unclassified Rhodococcus (in: high G+C Gram-positive bacteria)]MBY6412877.1 hypothetical protein [Rhodococcus sp. BP-320]MBY6417586.1 hypothetical protein [Rhodococcus sp. BP-321]MBY6423042.1 hypothetical protein [Rhodococcus sp. BP-324]MBY6427610.1 hypothetical protein [Rhodococcus sp. BP-323]MBY6432774.1 hypothetical protein [Rhodococcus sp. BP-322]